MFYFTLSPLQWISEKDFGQVFKATPVTPDSYMVSWQAEEGFEAVSYSTEDVDYAVAKGYWIKTDENGD